MSFTISKELLWVSQKINNQSITQMIVLKKYDDVVFVCCSKVKLTKSKQNCEWNHQTILKQLMIISHLQFPISLFLSFLCARQLKILLPDALNSKCWSKTGKNVALYGFAKVWYSSTKDLYPLSSDISTLGCLTVLAPPLAVASPAQRFIDTP